MKGFQLKSIIMLLIHNKDFPYFCQDVSNLSAADLFLCGKGPTIHNEQKYHMTWLADYASVSILAHLFVSKKLQGQRKVDKLSGTSCFTQTETIRFLS